MTCLLVLALLTAPGLAAGHADDFEARVRAAIVESARARLGGDPAVTLATMTLTAVPAQGPLTAVPQAGARSGRPSLFTLTAATPRGPRRVGSAVVVLDVLADHWRATRAIARGDLVSGMDVEPVHGIVSAPLRTMPLRDEIVAARALRDVRAGEALTVDVIAAVPLVRSGQTVRVRAHVGTITAEGVAIASQNGGAGAVIRVVNPASRRMLSARVVGPGEVEVVHGS